MKRFVILMLFALTSTMGHAQAQTVEDVMDADSKSLQERFELMKDKSETYSQYKVVKYTILNGLWKMTADSINVQKKLVQEANDSIAILEDKLSKVDDVIKSKDETIATMDHDTSHISVLGIDLQKGVFITVVGIIFLALVVLAGFLFTRLKWIKSSIKEKTDTASLLSQEFEEYKRKALEKQMKLSRELQTERNKLSELRN